MKILPKNKKVLQIKNREEGEVINFLNITKWVKAAAAKKGGGGGGGKGRKGGKGGGGGKGGSKGGKGGRRGMVIDGDSSGKEKRRQRRKQERETKKAGKNAYNRRFLTINEKKKHQEEEPFKEEEEESPPPQKLQKLPSKPQPPKALKKRSNESVIAKGDDKKKRKVMFNFKHDVEGESSIEEETVEEPEPQDTIEEEEEEEEHEEQEESEEDIEIEAETETETETPPPVASKGTYIPPALRAKQSTGPKEQMSIKLRSLLNKVTLDNLPHVAKDAAKIADTVSKHDFTEEFSTLIISSVCDPIRLVSTFIFPYAALVKVLTATIGDSVSASLFSYLCTALNKFIEEGERTKAINAILLFVHLHAVQVTDSTLIYSIVRYLAKHTDKELYIELLMILISVGGQQLRSENANAFKRSSKLCAG